MAEEGHTSLGIIGCGHVVVSWHLPALRHVVGLRVAALADTNPERLRLVADRWDIPTTYGDGVALARDPEIDAVAICVPAAFHAALAVEALEAGKAVFIEKPLALSLQDCDRVMDAAEGSDRAVMVGFNLRWHRLILAARELLATNRLGPLRSIRSVFTCGREHEDGPLAWRTRRVEGGGTLIEMAVHHFDVWRLLADTEIETVHVFAESRHADDDASVVSARLADGVLASGAFGEGTGSQNAFELFGERGRAEVELTRVDGLRLVDIRALPGDPRTHLRTLAHTLRSMFTVVRRWPATSDWERSFIEMWRHFEDCVNGEAEVGCTLRDGRRAVEVAMTAAASATAGRPIRVADAPLTITPPSHHRPPLGSI